MPDSLEAFMDSPLRHVVIASVGIALCYLLKFIYLTSTPRPNAALKAQMKALYGTWIRRVDAICITFCCFALPVYGLGLAADNDWRPIAFFAGLGVAMPWLGMFALSIAWRKRRPRFEALRGYVLVHDIPRLMPFAVMVPGVAAALAAVWYWLV